MNASFPAKGSLRVCVMGAGAVGCYLGGMLARAGHEVMLVARPQHVRVIQQQGLRMETRTFDEHVMLSASTEPGAVADADLVLFCVKSGDTESAGQQIRPHLRHDALVLCLQNGVDNADRLRDVLPPSQVSAAVGYVASEMAGPGHVKHHGRGELVIEPGDGAESTAQAFVAAGIPTDISDNVGGALWLKLIINCAYNAISAIAQRPYGELVNAEGVQDVMVDVVKECLAVAQADGVSVPGDVNAAIRNIVATMPGQYSSTAQDLARRKRTEIDYLNGYIVRRGQAHGIAVPVNRTLWAMVKLLENKTA
jgi:2-dehydropantoate 2-reductase